MNKSATNSITYLEFPKQPTTEQWTTFHAFRRLRHAESWPDDPLLPDDEVEKGWLLEDPYVETRRFVAFDGDRMVGSGGYWRQLEAHPAYATNAHFLGLNVGVVESHRRRGIASELVRQILQAVRTIPLRTVNASSEFPEGHAFLKSLGFEPKLVESENRLDLAQVDWALVERWAAEGPSRSPDTRLELHEPRVSFEALQSIIPTMDRLDNDVPSDDLEQGEYVSTPEMFQETAYAWMDAIGASHHLMCTREPDGTVSGLSDMNYRPSQPDRVYQMLTGVLSEHRGRGLGKWMKAAMLLHLRELYPDLRWVITGNANSNAPMLAINHALGFYAHREYVEYQTSFEGLREKLGLSPA